MQSRLLTAFSRRAMSAASTAMGAPSKTPIEDSIRSKITKALNPSHFEVYNDSALHAHHRAMQGNTSTETHFRLVIISDEFAKVKMQAARHRMVYALLKDEMDTRGAAGGSGGGIHALQLSTLTPGEAAAKQSAHSRS